MIDLDAVLARIDRAHDEIGTIAKEGPHRWRMSIPAQPERESDLIVAQALSDAVEVVAEVRALREESQEHKETAAAMARLATRRELELRAAREELEQLRGLIAQLRPLCSEGCTCSRAKAWAAYVKLTEEAT